MKDINTIKGLMWVKNPIAYGFGIKSARYKLPTGIECSIVVGTNEMGWEHVSVELYARRLPTWDEMCHIKDLFWNDDETVVQMHPDKAHYVNMTEALHLWRPVNGDWRLLNHD